MADGMAVDPDRPRASGFAAKIRDVVQAILAKLYIKDRDYSYRIKPCGSFPLGHKVGDLDEFDFYLEKDFAAADWAKDSLVVGRGTQKGIVFVEMACLDQRPVNISKLRKSFWDLGFPTFSMERVTERRVCVSQLYWRGPAVCLKLLWACDKDHIHTPSIDLTWTCAVPGVTIGEVWSPPAYFSHPPLAPLLPQIQASQLVVTMSNTRVFQVSFNVVDPLLFSQLEVAYPNLWRVYVILKHLRDHVFPSQLKPHENGIETGRSDEFVHDQVVSSHMIKCLLLRHLAETPAPADWSDERMCERVVSVLGEMAAILNPNAWEGEYTCRYPRFYTEGSNTRLKYRPGSKWPAYDKSVRFREETLTKRLIQTILYTAREDIHSLISRLRELNENYSPCTRSARPWSEICRSVGIASESSDLLIVDVRKPCCPCGPRYPYSLHPALGYPHWETAYQIDRDVFSSYVAQNGPDSQLMFYYPQCHVAEENSKFQLDHVYSDLLARKLERHLASRLRTSLYYWLLSRKWSPMFGLCCCCVCCLTPCLYRWCCLVCPLKSAYWTDNGENAEGCCSCHYIVCCCCARTVEGVGGLVPSEGRYTLRRYSKEALENRRIIIGRNNDVIYSD